MMSKVTEGLVAATSLQTAVLLGREVRNGYNRRLPLYPRLSAGTAQRNSF